ncbi:hypothetical protein BAQ47_15435 [Bacillus tropicus]|nr:hypothetical protein BAQ47_15435 [Bacillus tropicus]
MQLQSANNAKSFITNFILIFHFFVYSIVLIKKDVILTSFLVKKRPTHKVLMYLARPLIVSII